MYDNPRWFKLSTNSGRNLTIEFRDKLRSLRKQTIEVQMHIMKRWKSHKSPNSEYSFAEFLNKEVLLVIGFRLRLIRALMDQSKQLTFSKDDLEWLITYVTSFTTGDITIQM